MVLKIGLEPNSSSGTMIDKLTSQLSRIDQMLTSKLDTKSKGISKMVTTSCSTDNLHCTRCPSWAIESRSFLTPPLE